MRVTSLEGKVAVYIGRFAPFHNAHRKVINDVLALNPKKLLVLIGSSNMARSYHTPFTAMQRANFVHGHFMHDERVTVELTDDYPYDNGLWKLGIRSKVAGVEGRPNNVVLVCPGKDSETVWYQNQFPEWKRLQVPIEPGYDSTKIRKLMFTDKPYEHLVPEQVSNFIDHFWPQYNDARHDFELVEEYKARNTKNQYPAAIYCADNVVTFGRDVLLIQRGKHSIGRGLWALPGGHVDPGEWSHDAAKRELLEETGIAPEPDPRSRRVYAWPHRDPRGRCITEAFQTIVGSRLELTPGDDAGDARWWNINDVIPTMMYADHYFILKDYLK